MTFVTEEFLSHRMKLGIESCTVIVCQVLGWVVTGTATSYIRTEARQSRLFLQSIAMCYVVSSLAPRLNPQG